MFALAYKHLSQSFFTLCFSGPRLNGHSKHDRHRDPRPFDGTSSVMSSDIETTSFFDSEDDASSRFDFKTCSML